MDIAQFTHSRLLKFLKKSKMERHDLKIEVLAPTSIESEVPKQQMFRAAEKSTPDDNVGNATSTKDLENGGPTDWSPRGLLRPVYVGELVRPPPRVWRKAPETPESLGDKNPDDKKTKTRIPVSRFKTAVDKVQRESWDSEEEKKSKKQPPEKPPRKSSIPKLSDRILAARKNAHKSQAEEQTDKTHDKEASKNAGNGDSIPVVTEDNNRLKENGDENTLKTEITEDTSNLKDEEKSITQVNEQLEEEFDKLYEEIVDKEVEMPYEILDTKIKDPEKLEIKFEEIVHQYDEEVKVEPADKARYSKIPLLKRRSEHEIKVPKQHERRLSLKTGNVTKVDKIIQSEPIRDDKVKINVENEVNEAENLAEDIQKVIGINNNQNKDDVIEQHPSVSTPVYNVVPTPDAELVKVGIFRLDRALEKHDKDSDETEVERIEVSTLDESSENNVTQVENNLESEEVKAPEHTETPPVINENAAVKHDKDSDETEIERIEVSTLGESSDIENNATQVENNLESEKVKAPEHTDIPLVVNEDAAERHDKDNDEIEVERIEVLALNKSSENNVTQVEKNLESEEVKAPEHIEIPLVVNEDAAITQMDISKVNRVENYTLSDSNISQDNAVIISQNDTVKVAVINFDNPPDDEFKSVRLLRNANSVEERTKSRFINKPVQKEDDIKIHELEEDVPIVKSKVSKIFNMLTSQENIYNDVNDTDNKFNEERESRKDDLPTKGNVSKILNRITSQDIEQNVRKEFNEIPKKRSVLSKIALFERPDLEPVAPKKPLPKYTKPQRSISEESKHSPKIVHEVLKPSIRYGQTDKQEVVTIDILKPVEVVTNNEEQVVVVEDVKEQTIVYENLDEPKADEIDTVQNEISTGLATDENVLPKIDTTLPIEVDQTLVENETNNHKFKAIDPSNDWKNREVVVSSYVPVKEKINRLKSYEEINIKRAKSTAELDLGDAVKGKVKNMIYRMNSSEMLNEYVGNKNKEIISIKERPRKRSVSEKIALFEKKLTAVKMDAVDSTRALNTDTKPDSLNNLRDSTALEESKREPLSMTPLQKKLTAVKMEAVDSTRILDIDTKPDSPNNLNDSTTLEEEYSAKIKALVNAKLTYGSTNTTYMDLADGSKIPVLALGTALLDPRLAKYIVGAAIDLGFRAIDTAFIYGNEKEVGEGIRAKINDGTVKREELFIINKLWSTFHQPELVEPACRASLRALGLDYFDLYVIHNPMSFKEGGDPLPKIANVLQFSSHDYLDAWFAMESLVPHAARRIGVSNFNSAQLTRVLDKGRVAPVINQVECHPYLNQQRLSDYCDARGVKLICFGTLGSKGTPGELKSSQAAAIDDPLVQVMAAGLGVSPAQLLISYQLHCGHGVVVKGSSAAHLWDNLQATGVSLSPAQIEALHALNRNKRTFTFKGMGDTHKNYPFKVPF